MKIINIKSKYSINDCKKILSSKIVTHGNIGVNWLSKENHKIILYYEDGVKTMRGGYRLAKSYFIGRIVYKKTAVYVNGIIVSAPIICLIALFSVCQCVEKFMVSGENIMIVFAIILIFTIVFILVRQTDNRNAINKYLYKIFS